ncbi:hypothetical protein [Ktedonospora formicarum]|uniref:ASCH domain-containing protein n=1 Tax=Ktedonospora formicarum TaxID=2778364 RepID=A0A8J3N035_9CHLR|nr:hypothetical protein [Ktedonospora formicarum]GHO51410.1 hypothetical protein KSX_95730 [Ktedonospora formicarum]
MTNPLLQQRGGEREPVPTMLLSSILQRDTLKALTLTEPWCSLMRYGAKGVETRSWTTQYRGPVALHAAKTLPKQLDAICELPAFAKVLKEHGHYREKTMFPWKLFPVGKVLAIGMLEEIVRTEQIVANLDASEVAFGDYTSGRYAWRFSAIYPLKTPIPVQGALWLWNWTPPAPFWDEIQQQMSSQLEVTR